MMCVCVCACASACAVEGRVCARETEHLLPVHKPTGMLSLG